MTDTYAHLRAAPLDPLEWWNRARAELGPQGPDAMDVPLLMQFAYYELLALRRRFRRPESPGGARPISSLELALWMRCTIQNELDAICGEELTLAEIDEAAR